MAEGTMADRVAVSTGERIRTLIIGAGIAGTTLAALLRQRGEAPAVIEKTALPAEQGYMLALYPQGSRVLHGLGLFDRYLTSSTPLRTYEIVDARGHEINAYDLEPINMRFGPLQSIRRATLLDLLTDAIGNLPIHRGLTVTELSQSDDDVTVTFADGSKGQFDLVVAADGLHSETRAMLLAASEYSYWESGWGGWVFWGDRDHGRPNTVRENWGPGRFVWTYPVEDRLGIFAGGPTSELKQPRAGSFSDHVRELFSSFPDDVRAILDEQTLASPAFFWDFHDCRATVWHKGRVVLLGDAATGLLPTAGVGASMAMESAAALSDELSRTDGRFVERALTLFEKRHRRRVEAAQDNSRLLAKAVFMKSAVLSWGRDQLVKHLSVETLFKDIADMIDEPI